jgi:hypothetical protein
MRAAALQSARAISPLKKSVNSSLHNEQECA